MEETWKVYNGKNKELHGIIMISDCGNVYRIEKGKTNSQPKLLKPILNSRGYATIHISINGKSHQKSIHRLVAEMYCDNPHDKKYVDHINAIRNDNRASNLRWVTHSENCNNPIYIEKLSKRMSKKVMLIHEDGAVIVFDKLNDIKKKFNIKSNLSRKVDTGEYFTSKRSKLRGYKIETL